MGEHGFGAIDGFQGSNEDGDGFVGFAADDVAAEVHAVGEVDVERAAMHVHGFVLGSASTLVGVAAGVFDADVGLSFDDGAGEAGAVGEDADEDAAEEIAGDGLGEAGVEGAGEAGHE